LYTSCRLVFLKWKLSRLRAGEEHMFTDAEVKIVAAIIGPLSRKGYKP
jgi:hypothetical protein